MGWRVAAAEKNSIKGVISPDTDLKKNRRIAPKRELSCGLRLLECIRRWPAATVAELSGRCAA